MRCPLTYKVISECTTTKARVGVLNLCHGNVDTPVGLPKLALIFNIDTRPRSQTQKKYFVFMQVFMPVGTQGTLKGVLPDQLINLNCQIILGNTYHLGQRPVGRVKYKYNIFEIQGHK